MVWDPIGRRLFGPFGRTERTQCSQGLDERFTCLVHLHCERAGSLRGGFRLCCATRGRARRVTTAESAIGIGSTTLPRVNGCLPKDSTTPSGADSARASTSAVLVT